MRRLIITLTVFAAFAAAPAFAVVPRDLRSPDAQDAARQVTVATATDLRSPDARDSERQVRQATASDLRSPDARDVRRVATYTPGRVVVSTPSPIVHLTDGGFSWGDAGIGAAGTLGLIALIAGTGLIVSGRRRDRRLPIATS